MISHCFWDMPSIRPKIAIFPAPLLLDAFTWRVPL